MDPDGDKLRIVSVSSPTPKGGSIIINDNNGAGSTTVTYTPPVDFVGSDSFAYTISDGKGATSQGTVKFAIKDIDSKSLNNNGLTTQKSPVKNKQETLDLDKGTGETKSTKIKRVYNKTPIANAGPDLIALEGTGVVLDGSNSVDKDGKITSYKWEQTIGPRVLLTNSNQEKASFLTPPAPEESILGFKLTVSDNAGSDSSDGVNIMIINGTRER